MERREFFGNLSIMLAAAMFRKEFGREPRLVDFPNDRFYPYPLIKMKDGIVLLDGVDVTMQEVFYASEAEGAIQRYKKNAQRRLYVEPGTDYVARHQKQHGEVRILLPGEKERW